MPDNVRFYELVQTEQSAPGSPLGRWLMDPWPSTGMTDLQEITEWALRGIRFYRFGHVNITDLLWIAVPSGMDKETASKIAAEILGTVEITDGVIVG